MRVVDSILIREMIYFCFLVLEIRVVEFHHRTCKLKMYEWSVLILDRDNQCIALNYLLSLSFFQLHAVACM